MTIPAASPSGVDTPLRLVFLKRIYMENIRDWVTGINIGVEVLPDDMVGVFCWAYGYNTERWHKIGILVKKEDVTHACNAVAKKVIEGLYNLPTLAYNPTAIPEMQSWEVED